MISVNTNNNWFDEQVLFNGQKVFIELKDSTLNFTEVKKKVDSLTNYLGEMGINKQARVAVIVKHNADFIITVLAIWKIGAVPVPINLMWDISQINEIIEKNEFTWVITDGSITGIRKTPYIDIINLREVDGKFNNLTLPPFNLDNEALILFTSGSTDKPKGVIYTFGNLLQSALNVDSFVNHTTKDKWLAGLPFYHIGGFSIITRSLLSGNTIYIPESTKHDGLSYAFLNKNVTLASLVTTQLKGFVDKEIFAPPNLRYLFLGGGPSEKALIEKAIKYRYPVTKVYGSTETSSMVTIIDVTKNPDRIESSGQPLGDVKIEMKGNKNQEIRIKSGSVAEFYLIENKMLPIKDKDDFYNSGDIGFLKDNYLYITDRKKRIIISGGENISALEIENVLLSHPDIIDAFVKPIQDDKWGEVPLAVIVLSMHSQTPLSEIIEDINLKLLSYKQPKRYLVLDEIPRNELGKINNYELDQILKRS